MKRYKVFTRTWWKFNKDWPNGLEPSIGKPTTLGYTDTIEEAISMCKDYNDTYSPGPLSRKAEFTNSIF